MRLPLSDKSGTDLRVWKYQTGLPVCRNAEQGVTVTVASLPGDQPHRQDASLPGDQPHRQDASLPGDQLHRQDVPTDPRDGRVAPRPTVQFPPQRDVQFPPQSYQSGWSQEMDFSTSWPGTTAPAVTVSTSPSAPSAQWDSTQIGHPQYQGPADTGFLRFYRDTLISSQLSQIRGYRDSNQQGTNQGAGVIPLWSLSSSVRPRTPSQYGGGGMCHYSTCVSKPVTSMMPSSYHSGDQVVPQPLPMLQPPDSTNLNCRFQGEQSIFTRTRDSRVAVDISQYGRCHRDPASSHSDQNPVDLSLSVDTGTGQPDLMDFENAHQSSPLVRPWSPDPEDVSGEAGGEDDSVERLIINDSDGSPPSVETVTAAAADTSMNEDEAEHQYQPHPGLPLLDQQPQPQGPARDSRWCYKDLYNTISVSNQSRWRPFDARDGFTRDRCDLQLTTEFISKGL